jgi:hypothetical protein
MTMGRTEANLLDAFFDVTLNCINKPKEKVKAEDDER